MNEFSDGNGAPAGSMSAAPTASSSSSSAGGEMTLAKVVEILTTLSDMVGNATDSYCETFIKSFGLPHSHDLMQQFQGGMLQMSES
jgi:hypothetical protein